MKLPLGMSWRKADQITVAIRKYHLKISFRVLGCGAFWRRGHVWFSSKIKSQSFSAGFGGLAAGLICGIAAGAASWGGNIFTETPLEIKPRSENVLLKAHFQVCCKAC